MHSKTSGSKILKTSEPKPLNIFQNWDDGFKQNMTRSADTLGSPPVDSSAGGRRGRWKGAFVERWLGGLVGRWVGW